MSHFLVGVILPKGSKDDSEVEELLEPYSESFEVDPYQEKCWCVGREAERQAEVDTEIQLGSFDAIREKYNKLPENIRPEWGDWTKPFMSLRKAILENHPLKNAADPSCEDCKGSGTRTVTYNPDSKWDWWEVGGRWTGAFGDYDPYKDNDNYEPCNMCKGTGKRNDKLGKEARAKDPKYTCNGCNGTGKSLKFRLKNKDNIVTVDSLMKRADIDKRIPFAVVTPDGKWHEKGEMGWFGIAHNEKDENAWVKQIKKLIGKYKGHYIVAVDCHI